MAPYQSTGDDSARNLGLALGQPSGNHRAATYRATSGSDGSVTVVGRSASSGSVHVQAAP
jgi:hypothetical protein